MFGLLNYREVEIKKINEENLQNLRKMERKFMNEEKEHEKTKEQVTALKVRKLKSISSCHRWGEVVMVWLIFFA